MLAAGAGAPEQHRGLLAVVTLGRLLAGAGCCWLLFISVGKIAFLSAGDISHISATLVNKVLCSLLAPGQGTAVCRAGSAYGQVHV